MKVNCTLSTRPILDTPGSNRILVLFPGALGDVICLVPTLFGLRGLDRANHVSLFCHSSLVQLLRSTGSIDDGYPIHGRKVVWLFSPCDLARDQGCSFFSGFDWIYSWTGANDPDFCSNLSRWSRGRCSVFPFRPPYSTTDHMVDYYLNCVGLQPGNRPFLRLLPEVAASCLGSLPPSILGGEQLLVIHPGSGSPRKNWPPDFFLTVASWWRTVGGHVLFLLGPGEKDIAREFNDWPCVNDLSLARLLAVLANATAYLGNDSGVTHLAAAAGTTTFVLFRSSEPGQWAPPGQHVAVFQEGQGDIREDSLARAHPSLVSLRKLLHRATKGNPHSPAPAVREARATIS